MSSCVLIMVGAVVMAIAFYSTRSNTVAIP
jgi:hypothetical protein